MEYNGIDNLTEIPLLENTSPEGEQINVKRKILQIF